MVNLVYFSPTGTTRKVVAHIAAGFDDADQRTCDLTRMKEALSGRMTQGVTIIAVPVYAGRVPEIVLRRIGDLKGEGLPVVAVVVYGNREYEDALRELADIMAAKGFHVVAAGAFIGEHSYSTHRQPVAANRPDEADLEKARAFGRAVKDKLLESNPRQVGVPIPGDVPYREGVVLGQIAPETIDEHCVLCGLCASVCPSFTIQVKDRVVTDVAGCIMCCACVKSCPHEARVMSHPVVAERRTLLAENFNRRREPEWFL